jgi:hypothetical protein
MTAVELVDHACDLYVASMVGRGIDPKGVRCLTLAHLAGCDPTTMSGALQEHLVAQGKSKTRYVLGCEGYGRRARWKILSKPNTDPNVVRQARVDHAIHIAGDAFARHARDVLRELEPGLHGTAIDALILASARMAANQMEGIVTFVESMVHADGRR